MEPFLYNTNFDLNTLEFSHKFTSINISFKKWKDNKIAYDNNKSRPSVFVENVFVGLKSQKNIFFAGLLISPVASDVTITNWWSVKNVCVCVCD